MKNLLFAALLLLGGSLAGAEKGRDLRPPFDKSGYKNLLTVQVNPWFPMNKERIHALGGPNYAYKQYTHENVWAQGMKVSEEYGIDVWQLEINEPGGWMGTYKTMLQEAKATGAKTKLQMFFGFYSKTPEESLKAMKRILGTIREELKSHPNLHRLNGRPVMMVYNPKAFTPEQWKTIFDGVEKEFGPMIFLVNLRGLTLTASDLAEKLRLYLPVFDGISNYGSSGVKWQREFTGVAAPIMHKEFPQKIYDGGIHSTYTCHFHMGGLDVDLSKDYRDSFETILAGNPDSAHITNLFDHYENSLILPCYEREDFLMRYMQYRIGKWRGSPFPKQKTPELVVTNFVTVLLGKPLEFEVIGFPIDHKEKNVAVSLELCNTGGEVLRTFPPRKLVLDNEVQVLRYSVPSTDFISERAVVPRLVYRWQGKTYKMNYNPMTVITPSIRNYRMYWARSTKNELGVRNGEKAWSINGKKNGETLLFPDGGFGLFKSYVRPVWNGANFGYLRHTIKRNGMEFYTTRNVQHYLDSEFAIELPNPGHTLQYYHLEMENEKGNRWQSLPVWVADGKRTAKVKIPVQTADGKISDHEIEEIRVPYFHYPCENDYGHLLLDVSGNMHNGYISGEGYGGGHLGYTGYNYYHNGPVPNKGNNIFRRDENGCGMLHFSGKEYVVVMGGSAFPRSYTYELSVRPKKLGREMGLIGTANNQICLNILADGRLQVIRGSEIEADGGTAPAKRITRTVTSRNRLSPGKWHRIAVVYDLRKVTLYLDGQKEGEVDAIPMDGHEWINHVLIGAKNKWVWSPCDKFEGDMRQIRFYGRNLQPGEFLNETPAPAKADPYLEKKISQEIFNLSGKSDKVKLGGAPLKITAEGFVAEKSGSTYFGESTDIEPDAEYEISLRAKNTGKPFSLYVGFATDVAAQTVHTVPGSETELVQEVTKGDTVLKVKDASGWQKGRGFFAAFRAEPVMAGDLPNRNLSKPGIKDIRRNGDIWEIELTSPSPLAAAKGEFLREHRSGSTFNFIHSQWLDSGKWTDVKCKVKGIAAGAPEKGKFWPGTKKGRVVISFVGSNAAGIVDNIRLVKTK